MLDPWIFRKLADHESCGASADPTPDEQIDFLVRHFYLMADQHGDYACTLFRKFAAWYGARLGIPEDLEGCGASRRWQSSMTLWDRSVSGTENASRLSPRR